jgi:hypothetical protein
VKITILTLEQYSRVSYGIPRELDPLFFVKDYALKLWNFGYSLGSKEGKL